jgi:hypothetical protein
MLRRSLTVELESQSPTAATVQMSHNEALLRTLIGGQHEIMSERHHVLFAAALFLTGVNGYRLQRAGSTHECAWNDGGTRGGGGTNGSGTGGTGAIIDPNQGGTGMRDPNDTRDVPVRKKTCDANGMNCTCLRLALLGTLDSLANQKDTQPFVDWLNGNSGGSAPSPW